MNRVPEIGELVAIALEDNQQYFFRVSKRTRKDGQAFIWDGATAHKLEDILSQAEAEIDWANLALNEATDEVAIAIHDIFTESYGSDLLLRKQIWEGLTPENQAKMMRFKAIAEAQQEVAA